MDGDGTNLDDHELARDVAEEVGRLLLALRDDPDIPAPSLKDEADRRAHLRILELLGAARPDDSILSEEGRDDTRRLAADRIWIVDPLDGTREYGEPGRVDWAVHIALVDGDGRPLAGAVALPAEGLVLTTGQPPVVPDRGERRLRVVTSRTRRPPETDRIAEVLGAELVLLGSAGAKAMAVVRGDVDIYAHAGGQYQWDSCAPVAVAIAAGLHTSRLDGSPLVYNDAELSLPDLLVCRPDLAEACLAALVG